MEDGAQRSTQARKRAADLRLPRRPTPGSDRWQSWFACAKGLEKRMSVAFGVGASPASAQVRSRVVATMDETCRFRHRRAGRRCTLIPPASGLMTESACGSSTHCFPARSSLASVRAAMRRREPSRLDVEHPSMRREQTRDSAAVQYLAMVRQPAGVVDMLGEQSTSVSDGIQGAWETCEVYVAGGRLNPSESLAVARHSTHGFRWGDGGSDAAQLALALR